MSLKRVFILHSTAVLELLQPLLRRSLLVVVQLPTTVNLMPYRSGPYPFVCSPFFTSRPHRTCCVCTVKVLLHTQSRAFQKHMV